MIQYLEGRNRRILQLAKRLNDIIRETQVSQELAPFKHFVVAQCDDLSRHIQRNLQLLQLRKELGDIIEPVRTEEDFLKELLGETSRANHWLQRLSGYYAPPILRAHPHDRLSLSIIGWLHQSHPDTRQYPPVVNSGSVAIEPRGIPPVYYFPVVEQRGLLYQPLVIHEYGHFLYTLRRRELNDLVAELQEDVLHWLHSSRFRNDPYAEEQAKVRQIIAYTWYAWAEELFCDAVGLTMGGSCYLRAFSGYLHTLRESDFRQEPGMLRGSAHPPCWLRVQFLVCRGRRLGLAQTTDEVTREWEDVRDLLGIFEDYYGYYSPELAEGIEGILDDMLTEVDPRQFTEDEALPDGWRPSTDSPIQLLNWAWRVYEDDSDSYPAWEKSIIGKYY